MLEVDYNTPVEEVYIAFATMLYYGRTAPLGWMDYARPEFHSEFEGFPARLEVDRVNFRFLSVAGAMRNNGISLELSVIQIGFRIDGRKCPTRSTRQRLNMKGRRT